MDPYLGEIRMFAGNFAPQGWAFCNGQILQITQNTALFAILGTTYGGNGTSTFALPNLQGRVPMHWGSGQGLSSRTLGQADGSESVQLLPTQMPTHNHMMMVASTGGDEPSPSGAFIAETVDAESNPLNSFVTTGASSMLNAQSITPAGSSQPHSNVQPFLCVSFIIALQGAFPPRS